MIGVGSGKDQHMAFEDKEAELGLLLTRMQNEPADLHELYLEIPSSASMVAVSMSS